MRTLREIRNQIADLESEKTKLNAEIEELREKAETKAEALKEAESLKELLDA